MEKVKRTVDELNELAYKLTGVNPKAKTDAQALNYIEQNMGEQNNIAKVYMYDVYTNSDSLNEIDLTSKQLVEINEKTKGHFLLYVYWGDGLYNQLDDLNIVDGNSLISNSVDGSISFMSEGSDIKFHYEDNR